MVKAGDGARAVGAPFKPATVVTTPGGDDVGET